MKNILKIIWILTLTFMVTACNNDIKGHYKLIEITANGLPISGEALKQTGLHMELTIIDEENAILTTNNEEQKLVYDDKELVGFNVKSGENDIYTYTLDGNKITLIKDNEKMVFKK